MSKAIGDQRDRVVVLNHPRDLHSGFRPFAPTRHVSLAGEDRDGLNLPAGAMELVNSGALQTDPWRLVRRLVEQAAGDMERLAGVLADYDEATAIQAAAILRQRGELTSAAIEKLLASPNASVRGAVNRYLGAWR